jgi:Flp pilus assembly CpaF family ATPase
MVDRLNKDGVINLLKIMNTGHSEHLQRRIQSRMDALAWVENEIKMKENFLNSLDNRIREFSYREGDIIPMTNSSANELTHSCI